MKKTNYFIIALTFFIMLFPSTSFAIPNEIHQDLQHLHPNHLKYVEDSNGTLTIEQFLQLAPSDLTPVPNENANFGYTSSVYWLTFDTYNRNTLKEWILEIDSPPLDSIHFFTIKNGTVLTEIHGGDLLPFEYRYLPVSSFVFPLALPTHETYQIVLRVETEGAMKIPLELWEKNSFLNHNGNVAAAHMFYYGLAVVMAVYNFFLYLFLRNSSYLYYAALCLAFMFIPMTNYGDAYRLLWPEQVWWNNRSIVFFMGISIIFSGIFVMKFLRTKEMLPRIHKLIIGLIALQIIDLFILLFVSYPIALYFVFFTTFVHVPLFLFAGIISWRNGYFLAKYFLFAWTIFLVSNSIALLNDVGIMFSQDLAKYSLLVGSGVELVLFAVGLSAQVNEMRKEKELLNKEIEEAQREIVYTMGEVIEARSKETSNHVKRVAAYSVILAQAYGMDAHAIEKLKVASPLHDVGKVGIPDEILQKPGKLTDTEFTFMQTHTLIGYNMLKNSNLDILKIAAIIAHEHHEKYNGRGYPRGIAGEDINIYARITAIADVFDALSSERAYKKAWPLEKILALFKEERGEHFDPHLVDLFFEHLEDFVKVREELPD